MASVSKREVDTGRQAFRLLSLGFLIGIGLVFGVGASLPDGRLHMVVCDVGQGDAILLTFRSRQILVDGGPDDRVVDCLSRHMPFWDRALEVIVLTHPQADHMNGLVDVLRRYDVSEVFLTGATNTTDGFMAFKAAVLQEGASLHFARRGDEIRLEPLALTVVWPKAAIGTLASFRKEAIDAAVLGETTATDVNETSVVLLAQFGTFRALMTGDIGIDTEQALLRSGALNRVDVLKVAHHGSKYATSSDFLSVIRPQLALISAGKKNRYGHPTSDTLMRLDSVGAEILRTDERGDIEIMSNGEDYWVLE